MKRSRNLFTPAIAIVAVVAAGCGALEEYPDEDTVSGDLWCATWSGRDDPRGVWKVVQGEFELLPSYLGVAGCVFGADTTGFRAIARKQYVESTLGGAIFGPIPTWWNPLGDAPTVLQSIVVSSWPFPRAGDCRLRSDVANRELTGPGVILSKHLDRGESGMRLPRMTSGDG